MNKIKSFLRKIIIKNADGIVAHRKKSNKEFTQEDAFLNIMLEKMKEQFAHTYIGLVLLSLCILGCGYLFDLNLVYGIGVFSTFMTVFVPLRLIVQINKLSNSNKGEKCTSKMVD